MTIYLITGETGEYDDHYEWIYKAYRNKKAAQSSKNTLNRLLKKYGVFDNQKARNLEPMYRTDMANKIRTIIDPGCTIDYTGASYRIKEIELEE